MGLKLATPTEFGATAEYWKVVSLSYWAPGQLADHSIALRGQVDSDACVMEARFGLFVDKTAADTGAAPMAYRQLMHTADLRSEHNLVAQAYIHAKAAEEFAGAEDVLEEPFSG